MVFCMILKFFSGSHEKNKENKLKDWQRGNSAQGLPFVIY